MAVQPPEPVRRGEETLDIASSPRHALLRALRTRHGEVQLTQVIGAMAAVDSKFATGFVQAVLNQAADDCKGHEAAQAALGAVPKRVVGRIEKNLVASDGRDHGRADLIFTDKDRESRFTLLVENKLYADFHDTQLSTYRDWIIDRGENAAFVAVTRDLPTRGELAAGEPSYLGSVRWGNLYTPLTDISFDAGAREQWRCFLEVLKDQGDLGMTEFNPAAARGWAYARTGRDSLVWLLGQIARATEAHTRDELAKQYPDAITDKLAKLRRSGEVRTFEEDGLSFFVHVPADADTGFHVHASVFLRDAARRHRPDRRARPRNRVDVHA
jgi:hypothetical protein